METENGVVTQVVEVPNVSDEMEVENVMIEITDNTVDESVADGYSSQEIEPVLKSEAGKVYLVVADVSVDITEDFKDGSATGEIAYDGTNADYTVTGSMENYKIELIEQ